MSCINFLNQKKTYNFLPLLPISLPIINSNKRNIDKLADFEVLRRFFLRLRFRRQLLRWDRSMSVCRWTFNRSHTPSRLWPAPSVFARARQGRRDVRRRSLLRSSLDSPSWCACLPRSHPPWKRSRWWERSPVRAFFFAFGFHLMVVHKWAVYLV